MKGGMERSFPVDVDITTYLRHTSCLTVLKSLMTAWENVHISVHDTDNAN